MLLQTMVRRIEFLPTSQPTADFTYPFAERAC
jgi:hypothetical protein